MRDSSDMELVRDYARLNSETAFAELVQRHINLVYSAALRHVGIAAHAEEITQAVFIILARKSTRLRADTILEGWLHETTRLTALSFLRGERRRQFREQEAYMQSTLQENNNAATWNQLAPLLDEAVSRLGKKDRDAVMLRFFKDKNLREVATALNVNEAAAQRRVLRAVEKLRKFFTKRGVSSTTAIIAGTISANSVQAAPVALAKFVTVVAVAKGSTAAALTLTLAKGTMKTMTWLKIKFASGVMVAALLAVGGCLGKVSVKHAMAFEAEQKKRIAESLVVAYASADTSHLPKIRFIVREIWKGSTEAPAIGVTNGTELLLDWGAKDGKPPDHAVFSFPPRVSSTTASSNYTESYTEYPVRAGKVSGMWSVQEFKSKFGL